jgi:hypothetical protein
MKVGDLVEVVCGVDYETRKIGIIIALKKWIDIREVKVCFADGSHGCFPPILIKKI